MYFKNIFGYEASANSHTLDPHKNLIWKEKH